MNKCIKLLAKKKLSITFLESASAGYLAYRFSQNKYSGDILYGGLVCYDMGVKENILKIKPEFIKKYTPESMEVTQEMVRKAKKMFYSDIYIACTGL
ncbi:CinA family protein, partial [uncultured Acinetobacter sp.]